MTSDQMTIFVTKINKLLSLIDVIDKKVDMIYNKFSEIENDYDTIRINKISTIERTINDDIQTSKDVELLKLDVKSLKEEGAI